MTIHKCDLCGHNFNSTESIYHCHIIRTTPNWYECRNWGLEFCDDCFDKMRHFMLANEEKEITGTEYN